MELSARYATLVCTLEYKQSMDSIVILTRARAGSASKSASPRSLRESNSSDSRSRLCLPTHSRARANHGALNRSRGAELAARMLIPPRAHLHRQA